MHGRERGEMCFMVERLGSIERGRLHNVHRRGKGDNRDV